MNKFDCTIAGAMSGTSADGVDIAIIGIIGRGLDLSSKLISHHHLRYSDPLKREIFAIRRSGTVGLDQLAKLGREISLVYAQATKQALAKANLKPDEISGIAAHGQTLFHNPPDTIQWLDPALLAAEVGCPVISDFRRADCAAGGQGAPLVPFADYILFRHPTKTRVLLNIGGIANITWLKAGGSLEDVIAFDTGPGNCILDHLCRKESPDGPGYDVEGKLSSMASPIKEAVAELLAKPFFKAKPPRSTDAPAMIEIFESVSRLNNATFSERLSTAVELTVESIQAAIKAFCPVHPDELIVSGGGVRNRRLMEQMRLAFKGDVKNIGELGMPAEAKEAVAFALLGAATLQGFPSNVPSVTGARRAVILGSVTPKP